MQASHTVLTVTHFRIFGGWTYHAVPPPRPMQRLLLAKRSNGSCQVRGIGAEPSEYVTINGQTAAWERAGDKMVGQFTADQLDAILAASDILPEAQ